MINYIKDIWKSRFFWFHLARAELKYKFRRSKLGLLWTMIHPLMLTLMMALIFGNIFNFPMEEFAPYVYSGLIVWDFLIQSVIGGCISILGSEAYVKQFKHPMAIYPLKTSLVNIVTFLISFCGLVLWITFSKPENLFISFVSLPIFIFGLLIVGIPISIIMSFVNIKYRDFSQVMTLVMQLIWYMSPVFFQKEMFSSAGIIVVLQYNPVTRLLNLVRNPLLEGIFPSLIDFLYVIGFSLIFWIIAVYKIKKSEKELIFYY